MFKRFGDIIYMVLGLYYTLLIILKNIFVINQISRLNKQRWTKIMQEFCFETQYIKEKDNLVARI